jgi:hypothetical protein
MFCLFYGKNGKNFNKLYAFFMARMVRILINYMPSDGKDGKDGKNNKYFNKLFAFLMARMARMEKILINYMSFLWQEWLEFK